MSLVVQVDELFPLHGAAEEGDDPAVPVKSGVNDKAGHHPLVHGAEITDRVPDVLRACVDQGPEVPLPLHALSAGP